MSYWNFRSRFSYLETYIFKTYLVISINMGMHRPTVHDVLFGLYTVFQNTELVANILKN